MSEKKSRSKRWIIVGLAVIVLGVILFGLAILSLVSIGSRAPASSLPLPQATVVREVVVEKEVAVPMEAPAADDGSAYQLGPNDLSPVAERMIIRTAELAIVVEDTEVALLEVRGVATSLDGYLSGADVWRVNEQLRGRVTIRVPAESFDVAMDQIRGLAVEVESENVSAQDVTEEYTDLNARLRNLEATEEELLALLTEVREKTR
ncbi:MAG: DUF4349 domain-containing protein, partial [Anaerolineae bacterium]|nr:DUF4349 domain-containing protein [Anaerolineae bacterium]NIN94506.1 DUF4349 domain-containing protein [Anaerolineae bacterium]NIQ77574.1 DUF4349 domain-containing protein [Anaerolineae bacterium]